MSFPHVFPKKPVVLLTNDDGPPSPSSPNIYAFAKYLKEQVGWDVRVVIPDCQKSWVGKAYAISDVIQGRYFYPIGPDGLQGEITEESRPLKEGETMEWILLSGTPATCSNIALHNIYPGEIDLVLSGPNHGRNSSSAFCLSSGTIGAAMSSTLSSCPSIAISYGVVTRPVSTRTIELATEAAAEVVQRLWEDWGVDGTVVAPWKYAIEGQDEGHRMKGKVQLYNVNLALIDEYLERGKRRVVWTRVARNGYGSLFKTKPMCLEDHNWDQSNKANNSNSPTKPLAFNNGENSALPDPNASPSSSSENKINSPQTQAPDQNEPLKPAGPGAVPVVDEAGKGDVKEDKEEGDDKREGDKKDDEREGSGLRFFFSPELKKLIFPEEEMLEEGTDTWALFHGAISVTPLQSSFAEPPAESFKFGSERETKRELMEGELRGQWKSVLGEKKEGN